MKFNIHPVRTFSSPFAKIFRKKFMFPDERKGSRSTAECFPVCGRACVGASHDLLPASFHGIGAELEDEWRHQDLGLSAAPEPASPRSRCHYLPDGLSSKAEMECFVSRRSKSSGKGATAVLGKAIRGRYLVNAFAKGIGTWYINSMKFRQDRCKYVCSMHRVLPIMALPIGATEEE